MTIQKQTKKKRRKKKSNNYFTMVHQDAIVQYVKSSDTKERNKLYVELIQPAFKEMIEKIVFTYKFVSLLPNIDILKQDCLVYLTTILSKFDETKGHKAFSYFSVVTKHWFIREVKEHKKRQRVYPQYDEVSAKTQLEFLSIDNNYIEERQKQEFFYNFMQELKNWEAEDLKPNEERVLKAIQILFEDPDSIEIFNKKAIYVYLREITGLNTKQILSNLNRLRKRYQVFKEQWQQEENNL